MARQLLLQKFGYLLVDGHIEKVGNITLEPASLYRGRGEHPKVRNYELMRKLKVSFQQN